MRGLLLRVSSGDEDRHLQVCREVWWPVLDAGSQLC